MQTISLRDGARLRFDLAGSGSTLVLISGLGGTSRFWQPLVNALQAMPGPSLRTISFDQRGIGASERGTLPVSVAALAEDVWELVDELEAECPILCGHSTGGAIVQEMALMRPGSASGLVLSGSWAGPDLFMERMFKIRMEVLTRSPDRYAELGTLLGSPPRWLHSNPNVLEQAAGQSPTASETAIIRERIEALLAHDCRERLSGVTLPVLVLGAEDDMIVPVYLQEELASLLRGSQIEIFDKGGHFFPTTRTAETANLLRRWLSRVGVTREPRDGQP